MPDRPAGQSERMEAAFRRAFPLKGRPSRAEIAARDDWRFYFEAGYLAAVSPVGVEGEDEGLATGKMVEAACDSYLTSTGRVTEGAMERAINAALAASPSSPTGSDDA